MGLDVINEVTQCEGPVSTYASYAGVTGIGYTVNSKVLMKVSEWVPIPIQSMRMGNKPMPRKLRSIAIVAEQGEFATEKLSLSLPWRFEGRERDGRS